MPDSPRPFVLSSLLVLLLPLASTAAEPAVPPAPGHDHVAVEPVDLDMVTRIREEGLHASRVMEVAEYLTDVIGPRVTGSPQMQRAHEWTRDRLEEWGLEADLESWGEFGRGWSYDRATLHLVEPRSTPLLAAPKAWTRGTQGKVIGPVVAIDSLESAEDLEPLRGQLAGKIVLVGEPRAVDAGAEPLVERFSAEDLADVSAYPVPSERPRDYRRRAAERWRKRQQLRLLLSEEGVVAVLQASGLDNGVLRVGGGGSRDPEAEPGPPSLVVAAEHFNLLHRLLKRGPVEVEVEVRARFHDGDHDGYNTIADIPGTGPGLVMLGAHLDSWHAGTGATDNAAGVAVVMEAARILAALDVPLRRTVRVALWSGEEQGLLGSRGYVRDHFASRPISDDPDEADLPPHLRSQKGPLSIREGHEQLSAYFNLDNGTGRIRGIYLQGNAAARPIFEAWLAPFADLGATNVTMRDTSGTDHLPFDAVGLPAFQFIQDRVSYRTLTHHTNLDLFDHLQRDDLVQASVVMAAFAYHAAMRDQRLPRKPLPADIEPEDEEGDEEHETTGH